MIKIIFKFIKENHVTASPITREESTTLIEHLKKRLRNYGLDLTPISLQTLEKSLELYRKSLDLILTDEETMILLREIAAYIGEVLVKNTDGKWELLDNTIWGTSIMFQGKWKVMKENKKRNFQLVRYTLIDIAASTWQNLLEGKNPTLYSLYKNIVKKEIKETSTYSK